MQKWNGARVGCVAAGVMLLAACGGAAAEGAVPQAVSAKPTPAGDVRTVAPGDTSALETARRILRTGAVQHAIEVPMGSGRRFLAAAVPASAAFRTDSARGQMEVILIDIHAGGNQIIRPGLYADSLGSGGRVTLEKTMGAEDVTGDGRGEVWTAARMMGGRSWAIELRLYDHATRGLYTVGANTGINDETRLYVVDYSPNTVRHPHIRAWLARKAGAVASDLVGTPMKVDTLHQARQR